MARLAQIKLVLDVKVLTNEQINEYGRIAVEIAYQAAKEIYRENVKIDVFLEDGSLITKITLYGSLIFASYHGIASYPGHQMATHSDFMSGIAQLSGDAKHFSDLFVSSFLNKTGVSEEKIIKRTTSAQTPGKIKRLTSTLKVLDSKMHSTSPAEINKKLAKARHNLESIASDISDAEIGNLKTILQFHSLPAPSNWPTKPKPQPKPSDQTKPLLGSKAPLKAVRAKPHLRFHEVISLPSTR